MSINSRHPPSPTALTPRKCFKPSTLNARAYRAWERQPRATTIAIEGKARTIWKRFEGGAELDKENVLVNEEKAVVDGVVDGREGEVGTWRSPTEKVVKKMCLAGGRVMVKGWERRESGLMREFLYGERVKKLLMSL